MTVSVAEKAVIVSGSVLPAASVTWHLPLTEFDSGFFVAFSDLDDLVGPRDSELARIEDLLEDCGEQLARGLDFAFETGGRVDWNVETGGWFAVEGTSVEEELARL